MKILECLKSVQYEKVLESVGLVKFDFLGLKTLSVIKETIDLVKENRGISIDIDNLDLYDDQVYGMLREGRSTEFSNLNLAVCKTYLNRLNQLALKT